MPDSGLKIETKGFWKTLPLGVVGADKHGRPVQGKTWVQTQHSWFESLGFDTSSIGRSVKVDVANIDAADVGYIYVMRSAAHPKNVYKIGFTVVSPDARSHQLTAETGQPDMFNVVQSWKVKNPRAIERQVHIQLKTYRVNAGREFFQLRYEDIRTVIEKVIEANLASIAE
jgi:hypothetical protein